MNPDGKNPCDVCKNRDNCLDENCPMLSFTTAGCVNYECMLNYEGICIINIHERCGAWEGK